MWVESLRAVRSENSAHYTLAGTDGTAVIYRLKGSPTCDQPIATPSSAP
jgi:hypothetical protein